MKKFLLGGLAAVAAITPIAAAGSQAFAAQPTTTTSTTSIDAASEAFIDLPALNSQFTTMVITVSGSANWGAEDLGYWTSYTNGKMSDGADMISGEWGDTTLPEHGPLLLEGTQVGAVIYRVDGGVWREVTTTPITAGAGTHHVQVAYNDRPGSYGDNFGSLSITVNRTKS